MEKDNFEDQLQKIIDTEMPSKNQMNEMIDRDIERDIEQKKRYQELQIEREKLEITRIKKIYDRHMKYLLSQFEHQMKQHSDWRYPYPIVLKIDNIDEVNFVNESILSRAIKNFRIMLSNKNFISEITHDVRTSGWETHLSSQENIYTIYINIYPIRSRI